MPFDPRRIEAVKALIRLGWSPPRPNREQGLRMLESIQSIHPSATIELAPSELRLLQHLANGETIASAARRMHLSPHTTRSMAKEIRRKYGVHTITRVVALVVDEGLIEVTPRAGAP
jgi:DNA-binding NarL/FixJ family response regulator